MKLLMMVMLGLLVLAGCDRDDDNEVTLQMVEARLFQQGVQMEYSRNFDGSSNDGQGATCVDLYDIDLRAVNRTEVGVNRAIESLQLYRQIMMNGSKCVTDPGYAQELIFNAIERLERCRARWSDGLRCARI